MPLDGPLFHCFNYSYVNCLLSRPFFQTAAQSVQPTAVPPLSQGGEFSDLTELSHADLNGLVSEIEGEDEIFKQFGNFELDNIFAEFDEKVSLFYVCRNIVDSIMMIIPRKVGDCTTLLNNHTEADDFLRKRLAKRNYLDDHREVKSYCQFQFFCEVAELFFLFAELTLL